MRILIADDDPVPRRMLQAILMKWEYDVVVASDGAEAWEILQSKDAPKIAILDWLMPEIDGLEVCRQVRQRKEAPYVYLILLTSKDQKEDIVEGMEAGADDYLIKPFEAHRLQVRLRAGRRIIDLQTALLASLEELEQARRREVDIGARIQQTLLLGQPPHNLPGIQVAALTIPSQQIDGDFYDFFPHREQRLDVIVGDVMGKGVPAALFGAAVKSHFLRALSHLLASGSSTLPEPEEIVSSVHAEVTAEFIGLDSFMTLCYARFDQQNRRLSFVDCGHTKTIHITPRTGELRTLEGDSMPLGISEREVYTQVSVPFAPGDLFCFYSDGVTEARDASGELFGFDRLAATIRANSHLAPDALVESVHRAVVAFANNEAFPDDLTCVAVQIDAAEAGTHGEAAASAPPLSLSPAPAPQEVICAHATLEVASALPELARIRAFVRTFCRDAPPSALDEERIDALELAVNEAASNVMRHAYAGRTDARLELTADSYADRIVLCLYNTGVSFDAAATRPPSFDGSREGGFGVYMIANSLDDVRYFHDAEGRNCISMVKNRA